MLRLSQIKENIVCLLIKTLASHRINITKNQVKDITILESDVMRHIHSGSHVIETKLGFFRFCETHYDKKKYIKDRLQYHLSTIHFCSEEMVSLEEYFRSTDNLRFFVNNSLSTKFSKNDSKDFAKICGLQDISIDSTIRESFDNNLYELAYRLSADLRQYRYNKFKNCPQAFSANRIFAHQEIANLLGISFMFPHVEFVNLHIKDQPPAFGILMDKTHGVYPLKLKEKMHLSITPELQRELSILNIHDIICNEKDHRPGNYHVILDDEQNKVCKISVFDNDCKWTFFPSFSLKYITYAGASSLINSKGEINRPYVDYDYANAIMGLTSTTIHDALSPYLNQLQIIACVNKINRIKRAINKTANANPDFLIKKEQWSEDTIKEELSGRYGNTYLSIYVDWYARMRIEHPEIFESYNINFE